MCNYTLFLTPCAYTICPHFANLTTPIADLTTAIIYNSTSINAFSTSTIDGELAKNDPAEAEYFLITDGYLEISVPYCRRRVGYCLRRFVCDHATKRPLISKSNKKKKKGTY